MMAGWRVQSSRDNNSDALITVGMMDGAVYPPKCAAVQQNVAKSENLVFSSGRKC